MKPSFLLICCLILPQLAGLQAFGDEGLLTDEVLSIADMPEAALLPQFEDETEKALFINKLKTLKAARNKKKLMESRAKAATFGAVGLESNRITVYDCADERAVHKPINLHHPEVCAASISTHGTPKEIEIQVLQTGANLRVTAYQCLVTVTREVSRCGLDSIHYGTIITQLDEPVHLTPSQCRSAAKHRRFIYQGRVINVTLNIETSSHWYSIGGIDNYHNCDNVASLVSGGKRFFKSYETTFLKILIKPLVGTFDPYNGRVKFANGIVANFNDRVVLDDEVGLIVWNAGQIGCHQKISQVYKGAAELHTKTNSSDISEGDLVIVDQESDNIFGGFVIKSRTRVCTRAAFQTHLQGITIIILPPDSDPVKAEFKPEYLLQETHLQTGLGFLHLRRSLEVNQRFLEIQDSVCQIERQNLYSKLQLIADSAGSYALLDLYGPGHMLTRAGASAYLTICAPLKAELTSFSNCTQEIPIIINNSTLFADPLTYVIQKYPTILPCDAITPVRWKFGTTWMCSTPSLHKCSEPHQLKPSSDDDRQPFEDFTRGLGGGIFTKDQQERHREFVTLWNTRAPVVAEATRNALLHATTSGKLTSLYSQDDFLHLKNKIGMALIPGFALVGDYYSFLLGLFFTLTLFKIILGMVLRIYYTYLRKGCGIYLVASIWDTLFLIISVPWRILEATVSEAVNGPNKVGHHPNDDDQPPSSGGQSRPHKAFSPPELDTPTAPLPGNDDSGPFRATLASTGSLRSASEEPSTLRLAEWWERRKKDKQRESRYQQLTLKLDDLRQSQQALALAMKPAEPRPESPTANNQPCPL